MTHRKCLAAYVERWWSATRDDPSPYPPSAVNGKPRKSSNSPVRVRPYLEDNFSRGYRLEDHQNRSVHPRSVHHNTGDDRMAPRCISDLDSPTKSQVAVDPRLVRSQFGVGFLAVKVEVWWEFWISAVPRATYMLRRPEFLTDFVSEYRHHHRSSSKSLNHPILMDPGNCLARAYHNLHCQRSISFQSLMQPGGLFLSRKSPACSGPPTLYPRRANSPGLQSLARKIHYRTYPTGEGWQIWRERCQCRRERRRKAFWWSNDLFQVDERHIGAFWFVWKRLRAHPCAYTGSLHCCVLSIFTPKKAPVRWYLGISANQARFRMRRENRQSDRATDRRTRLRVAWISHMLKRSRIKIWESVFITWPSPALTQMTTAIMLFFICE